MLILLVTALALAVPLGAAENAGPCDSEPQVLVKTITRQ